MFRNPGYVGLVGQQARYVGGAPAAAPVLDGLTTFAAYSFSRKLYTAYAGNCIEVRRSSDSTTQNIGFDADGNLDAAALATFCGVGSGFIRTIYDQSGNTRDLTQTTTANQPRIFNAGVLETLPNGQPAAYFDGTNDVLTRASVAYAGTSWSFYGVVKRNHATPDPVNDWDPIWSWGTSNNQADTAGFLIAASVVGEATINRPMLYGDGWFASSPAPRVTSLDGVYLADPDPVIWDGTIGASTATLRRNGEDLSSGIERAGTVHTGTATLYMGGNQGLWIGHIAELVLFGADEDAALGTVRENPTLYYGCDLPERRGITGVSGEYGTMGQVFQWERTQAWSATVSILSRRLIAGGGAAQRLFFTNVTTSPYTGWEIFLDTAGRPAVRIINNISTNFLGAYVNSALTDGSPHVVTFTYDGSSDISGVRIYIDGVNQTLVTEANTLSASILNSNDMLFANQALGLTTWSMKDIDLMGLQIDSIVRDSTWVTSHATDATWPSPDADTEGSWRFLEGTGLTASDSSGNGVDITLSTSAMWVV